MNQLLAVECASAGMTGLTLTATCRDNVADGGVDAEVNATEATRWMPQGVSAWQFKSGDLEPASCKAELEGAAWAREILGRGGSYRLVLGAGLTPEKIERRREALEEQARTMGMKIRPDTFRVLGAEALARWTTEHPSLAVAPILGGIGHDVANFTAWQESSRHEAGWVTTDARSEVIDAIREFLDGTDRVDFRIAGVGGLGKTRVVLEALRGHALEAVVVYVRAADAFLPAMVNQLITQRRAAVVVVDECGSRAHDRLAEGIPSGSPIRLITIGEPDGYQVMGRTLSLAPLAESDLDQILQAAQPTLGPEARRVTVDMAAGNVKYALVLARTIAEDPHVATSELITAEAVGQYITRALPGGNTFLGCSALALLTRVGFDGEVATELEVLADALGLEVADLRGAAAALGQLGLISQQGRFRAVSPHPLAVYLATTAWREFGDRIVSRLLTGVDTEMAERLLRRAADIGEFAPTRRAVGRLLGEEGPFASLSSIAENNAGRLLTQLAIVAPYDTCTHVSELIAQASDDDLRALTGIRRDLVWTLEKLVWHSDTFETAADSLLRLATTEIESFGNNATGTWVELFGTMLPGTAAVPAARMSYLNRAAAAADPGARKLAASGAARALSMHESIMVSGEMQGGVVVEPRGTPKTYGELWDYQEGAIRLLRVLAADAAPQVAETAVSALVGSIHPLLENDRLRAVLAESFVELGDAPLRRARTEVEHLEALFARVSDVEGRKSGLQVFRNALPAASQRDELNVLAHAKRWDFEEGELQRRMGEAVSSLSSGEAAAQLTDLLRAEVPASYEIGRVLADFVDSRTEVMDRLVALALGPNDLALVGFLWGLVERGDRAAFDSFLDGDRGRELPPRTRLGLSVRGPRSEAGWMRVMSLIAEVSVGQGARSLFGWHTDIDDERLRATLDSWLARIDSQVDYNAAVDFAAMTLFKRPPWIDEIDPAVAELVDRRSDFPDLGQQSYDWVQLARRRLDQDPGGLLAQLLDEAVAGGMAAIGGTEESALLREVLRRLGGTSWETVMGRVMAGDWRLQMAIRDWLPGLYESGVVTTWIGEDLERARAVAAMTSPGGSTVSPVASFLLEKFGDDGSVTSGLFGNYISGFWSGPMSDRLAGQISQLTGWISNPQEKPEVKRWARLAIRDLTAQRETALQREAEGGF